MNIKERIEFVKNQKYSINEYKNRYAFGDREDCNKQIDEVIKCLQMWEDFRKERVYIEADVMALTPKYGECTIGYLLDKFEQKYSPKKCISELEALDDLLNHYDFTPSIDGVFRLIYQILKKEKEVS